MHFLSAMLKHEKAKKLNYQPYPNIQMPPRFLPKGKKTSTNPKQNKTTHLPNSSPRLPPQTPPPARTRRLSGRGWSRAGRLGWGSRAAPRAALVARTRTLREQNIQPSQGGCGMSEDVREMTRTTVRDLRGGKKMGRGTETYIEHRQRKLRVYG